MSDSADGPRLTGWQRAHVVAAADYLRDVALKASADPRARAVYDGLLDVLEPTRRVARQHREQHRASGSGGSMWDQRSGQERRARDRRAVDATPPAAAERRKGQRRGGRDRRASH